MRTFIKGLLILSLSGASVRAEVQTNSAAILQELKNFREVGAVLYIAAHPDDEDTQLITYLARGRHYRTAYLSVTRGDGGQNVLGPEFDAELGVIRTQELLAARRLDGGEQFFTRALDFGYSKDYRETLRFWDHQQVLSDVVRVIRTFQPDVVISGFSTNQTPGQHGHHVASAVLAGEAFKLAGDPTAFPDQLDYLKTWQPRRLVQNVRFFGRGGETPPAGPRVEINGNDPVLGISYGEIASRSRAMHKSQGFGNFNGIGGGPRTANFLVLDGEPATNDIMDGIDTTWARVLGGWEIVTQADAIIANFDTNHPSASVPALLKLLAILNRPTFSSFSLMDEKRHQFNAIIRDCLGIRVETTVTNAEICPGDQLLLHTKVTELSDIPVSWDLTQYFFPGSQTTNGQAPVMTSYPSGLGKSPLELIPGQDVAHDLSVTVSNNLDLSQPYWLQEDQTPGMFQVRLPRFIGRPEDPPVIRLVHFFTVDGRVITIPDEVFQAGTESGRFEARQPLKVIAPVSLACKEPVKLFAPGASRDVTVEVTAARPDLKGELSLDTPNGWKAVPEKREFSFAAAGERKAFSFTVTAPAQAATAQITARAKIGDKTYDNQRVEIRYPHIPAQLLQPPARFKVVSLDLAVRAKKVGYLPGAGDSVADAIREMGCDVTTLNGDDLTAEHLKEFDAVVTGVRAFNVRTDLVSHLPALFAYVEAGGTVVEQYNRPGGDLKTEQFTPYSLRLSSERVTDETAPMTFLAPTHPALNTPNKISAADFDGWVQERGIYFPNQWDEHFTPLLACADPGEAAKKGSLLVAKYGEGYFVYTGLDFFRELPDGVPGAYRLFANLISLGK